MQNAQQDTIAQLVVVLKYALVEQAKVKRGKIASINASRGQIAVLRTIQILPDVIAHLVVLDQPMYRLVTMLLEKGMTIIQ